MNASAPSSPAAIAAVTTADPAAAQAAAPAAAPQRGPALALGAPRIIALMNQKGGVGKTTTTVNLGAGLAALGQRVLMIDLDPQAHLTLHLGLDPDTLERSVYDLFTDPAVDAAGIARAVGERITVLPAEVNLAGVEGELAERAARGEAQHVLRDKCAGLLRQGPGGGTQRPTEATGTPSSAGPRPLDPGPCPYDFVLIDCPPSLGLLTVNALALAREVFVPMQAHFLALQGLSKLLETVNLVKSNVNPRLEVTGVILCMHEGQTLLAAEVLADLSAFLEAGRSMDVPWRHARVLAPPVRRNIKLAECPSFGKTIFDYAPSCPGAGDYARLAKAVAEMGSGT